MRGWQIVTGLKDPPYAVIKFAPWKTYTLWLLSVSCLQPALFVAAHLRKPALI